MIKKLIFTALAIMTFSINSSAQTANDTLVIAHMCDSQLGFGADGIEEDIIQFNKAIENVNRLQPDLVVMAGDMVHIPDSAHYARFFECARKFTVPVIYTPGNHDLYEPVSEEALAYYRSLFGDDFTVTKCKGRTIVEFNTQLFRKSPEHEAAAQREKLKAAVEKAKEEGSAVILVSHVPPFVSDIDEKEEYFNLTKADRRELLDFFADNGAFAWLCGHTHKSHCNVYKGISILNAENTSKSFDKRPKGFRLMTIAPDNTFTYRFIGNDEL